MNVWADLLGRRSTPAVVRRLVHVPILPYSSSECFEWPTFSELKTEQTKFADLRPCIMKLSDGLWKDSRGAVWVPDDANDLQLRLCITVHTGPSGHRGNKATQIVLRDHFFWKTVNKDVQTSVRSCIHCLSTSETGIVPRPFGPAFHGTAANNLKRFDCIEISLSTSGGKHVLMLRDDLSDYKRFYACHDLTAETAAKAIIDWCAAFGVPKSLMSDGPTHFKHETLCLVSRGLRVPHYFTLPYTLWSNGAVERLGKEMLRVLRSVLSELQMHLSEWPDLLPLVQSALSNATSAQRNMVASITAFTRLNPSPPISTFFRTETSSSVTTTDAQRERILNIEELEKGVAELHPLFQSTLQKSREQGRKTASEGALRNFSTGDFVLMAREEFSADEKLSLWWCGPRRIPER